MAAMEMNRRVFVGTAAMAAAGRMGLAEDGAPHLEIEEFGYGSVALAADSVAERQFRDTQATLQSLDEDGLLKPFRVRAGMAAPGPDLGGWYDYVEPAAATDGIGGARGFCPGSTFGQWLSSFARTYAADRDPAVRAKLARLLDMYGATISEKFYTNFRFPAYVYEKMNVGLLDAYRYGEMPQAKELFARTSAAAAPHLPPRPLDRQEQKAWRISMGERATPDFCWDESYTLPENLFLATRAGMGDYRAVARRYLLDGSWFDPLSRNENVLDGHHAYSYCNSLNSGMQAYLDSGDTKYLRAVTNGFRMITEQSFATGGWGPQEGFDHAGGDKLYRSLTRTNASFETPCGSYAHFKVTRALLRVTGDAAYGDSMERVMYNTILGALPLEANGTSFYYSDFGGDGKKRYHNDKWPCCSGTIGQVTADYRISTYFRDRQGVFVNLYLPSMLQFTAPDGAEGRLVQTGGYPADGTVKLRMELKIASTFALRLRVPAFSKTTVVRVNGKVVQPATAKGWASLSRRWQSGDVVDVTFDMATRLEAIDVRHPETVALVRGPLVLFAMGKDLPKVTRQQLLAVKPAGGGVWSVDAGGKSVEMRAFSGIGRETYQTYLTVG
jgi:DUF1680 family protein